MTRSPACASTPFAACRCWTVAAPSASCRWATLQRSATGARSWARSAPPRPTTRQAGELPMGTEKQTRAARKNVKSAQRAATKKRTIAKLPKSTRRGLQEQARRGRQRGGEAGHALEDRNRQQLYEIAKKEGIPGRSKMGKWELIDAIRERR